MTEVLLIDQLLDAAGMGQSEPVDEWEIRAPQVGAMTRAEVARICSEHESLRARLPLVERDLLTWFDTEGNYHQRGRHSALLEHVLRRSGLGPLEISDHWLPTSGCLIVARCSGETHYCLQPSSVESPSDYAEVSLILHSADELLLSHGSELRAYALDSGDQTAWVTLLPKKALDAIRDQHLLAFFENLAPMMTTGTTGCRGP